MYRIVPADGINLLDTPWEAQRMLLPQGFTYMLVPEKRVSIRLRPELEMALFCNDVTSTVAAVINLLKRPGLTGKVQRSSIIHIQSKWSKQADLQTT